MLRVWFLLFVSIISLNSSKSGLAQDAPKPAEYTPPIAVSGGVELVHIDVLRSRAGYAAPHVQLSELRLELWFPIKGPARIDSSFAVRFLSIEDVADDVGTSLLTAERRKWIKELTGFTQSRANVSHSGREGPEVGIRLDVPARNAEFLKQIKGVAEVSAFSREIIGFDNIDQQLGKALKHELLGDFLIMPVSLTTKDGEVICRLRTSEADSLLEDWTLMKDRQPLQPVSIASGGGEPMKGTTEEIRTFKGDSTEGLALYIRFGVKTDPQTFEFHFQDIPLP